MKKILALLGSVGMVGATAVTVVACNKSQQDINSIKNLDKTLGLLEDNRTDTIIKAFLQQNFNNDFVGTVEDDFRIEENSTTKTSAKISSTNYSKKFKGSVDVTFTIIKQDISTIKDLDTTLGILEDNQDRTIYQAFITQNADKLEGLNQTNFSNNSSSVPDENGKFEKYKTRFNIIDSNKYVGQINMEYFVKKNIDAIGLIKHFVWPIDQNDGMIGQEIINLFLEKNKEKIPSLKRHNLSINVNEEKTSAVISVFSDNLFYKGTITITNAATF
ncbi:lipoprotein [Williamsoniiplasma lucivorax]|uniref:Lipoprotein n=1 Tax=Williamsoniiplasma lucivorax TaxID=209274 RepID=A0A2S5RCQ8_9MOLU|nr:lipoprotein [Williamsoniiplasma lucivorax]PPE05119.1 hypothetical protein ELUCI_v1c06550 [Williamsoniiplasma lucivorax]